MKTNLLAALLVFTVVATDAFADRGRDRERLRSSNREAARADRDSRARSNRPRADRPRANRSERRSDRSVSRDRNRPSRPAHRPHRPAPRVDRHRPNHRPTHRPAPTHRPSRRALREESGRRSYYGTYRYHRPARYNRIPYRRYYHSPVNRRISHRLRYTPRNYYRHLSTSYRTALYLNWILHPSTRVNGYVLVNNYPYYVHNGYRHRYSSNDTCNYQLFDKYTHQVVDTYWNRICSYGYNECANDRDRRNERAWENRYECAETFRDRGYDFSRPTYEYDYSDSCYDYDWETNICYDNY